MIDANRRVGKRLSKVEQIAGKLDAGVNAGHELARGKLRKAAPPGGIDQIAALTEIPNSANVRISEMPVERPARRQGFARWHSATMPCG